MPEYRIPTGPEAPRSRRLGRAWSAAGTVGGLLVSWGAFWPNWSAGRATGTTMTGETVATVLAGLWLAALVVAAWRDRRA